MINGSTLAAAEVDEVKMMSQYGIGYMQLTLMQHDKLVEKHLAKAGMPNTKVTWAKMGAGAAANDALLAGGLHFAAGGTGPAFILWDRTRANVQVHVKNGKVFRVVPQDNAAVNECWIADRDRYSYEALNSDQRLTKPMVKDGAMENPHVDAVIGLHLNNDFLTGQVGVGYGIMSAAPDGFQITIKGVGGHGAHPHKSVDAIAVAAQVNTSVGQAVGKSMTRVVLDLAAIAAADDLRLVYGPSRPLPSR